MKGRYHVLVNLIILGLITYVTTSSLDTVYIDWYILAVPIATFSGLFPDSDVALMKIGPWVHRDIFWHSFLIPVISPILLIFFPEEIVLYSIGLFSIGYGAHLLFDFFPKMELRGFGLIHVLSDAKSESWSLCWLAIGFLISVILGAAIITLIVLL
ncbi:MAG: metal-dependent hydrolase [Promethearchaeota archaeon]